MPGSFLNAAFLEGILEARSKDSVRWSRGSQGLGGPLIVWDPGQLHTVSLPWVLSLLRKPFLPALTTVNGERKCHHLC